MGLNWKVENCFWSQISWSASDSCHIFIKRLLVKESGESKVTVSHIELRVDKNVAWLDVQMAHMILVHFLNTTKESSNNLEYLMA